MGRRVLVIGGGAAGATAAARAKRVNPSNEVVLIEAGPYITHAPCAIPYAIDKETKLYIYTAEEFSKERGVRVYTNTKAEITDGRVRLRGAHSGVLEWDYLIIATGATPVTPKIEGVELGGVYVVRHVAEITQLTEALRKARSVVIVGGGYIGLEMAETLLKMGKSVSIVESGRWVLGRMLDEDVGKLVNNYVVSQGAQLRLGETVKRVVGGERAEGVETTQGVVEGDVVVLSTGVRPNVEFAKSLGVKLGETGAVYVDEYLESSIPKVYAAGDVAEMRHLVTDRPVWIPLAPYANRMGYVAGTNTGLGDKRLRFPPVAGASVTKFFDMYIGKVGLNEREASEAGLRTRAVFIKTADKAPFMPDRREIYIKAIAHGDVLVGVQAVGYSQFVAAVIDFASQLIGKTLQEVILAEYSYMPHTGPVWHPLVSAARALD